MQGIRADRRKLILEILPVALLILLILVDQITKTYVKNLSETTSWYQTPIIDGFFRFTYTMNTGAAWSFLANVSWAQTFFKVLSCVALIGFYFYYLYACKKNYKFLKYSLVLIIGGTIGNLIDRFAYNGVVDFISFIFGSYHFPVFNLADAYMTIGIIMLVIHYFFLDKNAIFKKNANKKISN